MRPATGMIIVIVFSLILFFSLEAQASLSSMDDYVSYKESSQSLTPISSYNPITQNSISTSDPGLNFNTYGPNYNPSMQYSSILPSNNYQQFPTGSNTTSLNSSMPLSATTITSYNTPTPINYQNMASVQTYDAVKTIPNSYIVSSAPVSPTAVTAAVVSPVLDNKISNPVKVEFPVLAAPVTEKPQSYLDKPWFSSGTVSGFFYNKDLGTVGSGYIYDPAGKSFVNNAATQEVGKLLFTREVNSIPSIFLGASSESQQKWLANNPAETQVPYLSRQWFQDGSASGALIYNKDTKELGAIYSAPGFIVAVGGVGALTFVCPPAGMALGAGYVISAKALEPGYGGYDGPGGEIRVQFDNGQISEPITPMNVDSIFQQLNATPPVIQPIVPANQDYSIKQ